MEWLREHMRNHVGSRDAQDARGRVFDASLLALPRNDVGATALKLVEQAVEIIKNVQDEAAERHSRAESLARNAIEKLKSAEDRVRDAESARRAAERQLEDISERARQLEDALGRAESGMRAADARLSLAEERVRTADLRASEAEHALKRIEAAIRTRLLAKGENGLSAVAA